jgi:hypothetical protein
MAVALDDADQEIEKGFALRWLEHFEEAVLSRERFGIETGVELFALGRKPQQPGTPVFAVDAALQQPARFQSVDEKTGVGMVDSKTRGQAALVDIRLADGVVDVCHNRANSCGVRFASAVHSAAAVVQI